ncbi:hypothetical protein [Aquimarina sp. MMG016]|uniref:hypothetical protein n=1 Tax=Aquimarina sp. MMG016 TaxID=2822690 RepID=UPI001B3A453B|nr:hypothetical protein [Aquimarina sp. MMG016]MBQ4820581.1 hypothetical protein [Aquimarina sp. MMG016]
MAKKKKEDSKKTAGTTIKKADFSRLISPTVTKDKIIPKVSSGDSKDTKATQPKSKIPQALGDIRLGGSHPQNELIKFKMAYNLTESLIKELDKIPDIKDSYSLGGSYAAALRGTSRPPQDVDIDLLTPESYQASVALLQKTTGAKLIKDDRSMATFNFLRHFQREKSSRKIDITLKIELANIVTKNINKNVKEGMQIEPSTTDLHRGVKIPTVPTMIINWMERYIEAQKATSKVDKDKSKNKNDLRSIREITQKHGITYEQVKEYMKVEKSEYKAIWDKANKVKKSISKNANPKKSNVSKKSASFRK